MSEELVVDDDDVGREQALEVLVVDLSLHHGELEPARLAQFEGAFYLEISDVVQRDVLHRELANERYDASCELPPMKLYPHRQL